MHTQPDDEQLRQRQGRRVSLAEAVLWISAIAIALATPYWFGISSLLVFFYGTLAALSWRLSKAMPLKLAVLIAVSAAVLVTTIMVALIQRL